MSELTGMTDIQLIKYTFLLGFIFIKCLHWFIFIVVSDPKQMDQLGELTHEIMASYDEGVEVKSYDAYDLYLLGMITRRLGDIDVSTDYLVASILSNCYIWGAWVELAFLIMDRKRVGFVNRVYSL